MNSSKSMTGLLIGVLLAAVVGFGIYTLASDDESETSNTSSSANNVASTNTETKVELPFDLVLNELAPLSEGVYEGWIVKGDVKHSFGTFNTDVDSNVIGQLSADGITPVNGDTIAISIEPSDDGDVSPSDTIILAGVVTDGVANLEFPLDISSFSGQYILGTPTTNTTDDETAGIWFTSTGQNTLLDIPVAPAGWIYEGWAVVDGVPYTTGQFQDPSGADNFSGYSGPDGGPAKPGEDFIMNLPGGVEGPLELATGTSKVVVSIEPYQNGSDPTGPAPAQVKPLSHTIGESAADHTRFDLELSAASLPTGTATL